MGLLDAVPGYGLTLFGRGAAAVALAATSIAALRWSRVGLRRAESLSAPEWLVAVGAAGVWAFTGAPWAACLPGHVPQRMPANLVPVLPLLAGFTDAEGVRGNVPNLVLHAPVGLGLRWRFGMPPRRVVWSPPRRAPPSWSRRRSRIRAAPGRPGPSP